jgi:hypothetical protein
MASASAPQPTTEMKKPDGNRAFLNLYYWSNRMLSHQTPSAMTAIKQPSRDLTQHDWNTLETNLVSAMLSKAAAQLAAQAKMVKL